MKYLSILILAVVLTACGGDEPRSCTEAEYVNNLGAIDTGCAVIVNNDLSTTDDKVTTIKVSSPDYGLANTKVELEAEVEPYSSTISSYIWEQVSGIKVDLNDADTIAASFIAPSRKGEQKLEFSFTVTLSDGDTETKFFKIMIKPFEAKAGDDVLTQENTLVELSGVNSYGDIVGYKWTQIAGEQVALDNADTETFSFKTPQSSKKEVLVFKLTVMDKNDNISNDEITVTSLPYGYSQSNNPLGGVWEGEAINELGVITKMIALINEDGSAHFLGLNTESLVKESFIGSLKAGNGNLYGSVMYYTDSSYDGAIATVNMSGSYSNSTLSIVIETIRSSKTTLELQRPVIPNSTSEITGNYISVDNLSSFAIDSAGRFIGSYSNGCVVNAQIEALNQSLNIYKTTMELSSCGDWTGSYSGLSTYYFAHKYAPSFDNFPKEKIFLFNLTNGTRVISDYLVKE